VLIIDVTLREGYDEKKKEFVPIESFTLEMQHSLATLSKWESFFEKPFLSGKEKTVEETMWYVRAMVMSPNVPPEVFLKLSRENFEEINEYINASMTATTFHEATNQAHSSEIITAEIIYYWMISLNIWIDCENWHINRLLALIKVCNLKNAPPKKMTRDEMLAQRRALNDRRRAKTGSRG
jgi:hypothetical protein